MSFHGFVALSNIPLSEIPYTESSLNAHQHELPNKE